MSNEPLDNDQIGLSEPLPINTMGSEPVGIPPEPLESPRNADISVNDNPK